MTRAICTRWPDLDPIEVARWPWHRTAFFLEWLEEIAEDVQAEADDEQRAAVQAAMPAGAVGIEGLAALPGVQVREVS